MRETRTKTYEVITCDVCNCQLHEFQYSIMIELKGHNWDVCNGCECFLENVLTFLTVKVGIPIEYHIVTTVNDQETWTPSKSCIPYKYKGKVGIPFKVSVEAKGK